MQQLSDAQLVAEYRRTGDTAYFGELYERYAHLVQGVCLKYLKDWEKSRDVVSVVFTILHRTLPTREVKAPKSYIYTIARNECFAYLRKEKSTREKRETYQQDTQGLIDVMENEGLVTLLSDEPSADDLVTEAVSRLSDEQRICVHLFFYENRSYKEIAETTGYTLKQVKSYLQNGKRNLRNFLEPALRPPN